jgi:hypothetical protein
MDRNDSVRKFEHLMIKEADHALKLVSTNSPDAGLLFGNDDE